MIFRKSNLEICKWSKCDKGGYRGYHTPIEWEQHRQYVKIDLPPPIYPVQFEEIQIEQHEIQRSGAMPARETYYTHSTTPQNNSRKWQYASVATLIAVWGIVIWSIIKIGT